ncbi:uncharacterized protein SOCEGT47_041250 [Sorangium cellulosum]|uniref:Uncharacterized protein n=1 Tax=Sorangium cellulosum TaxID=56 RepID=A0A4P2Q3M3_SORCE|nr:DUF6334 family protein [Sorangium cellulosum]AUX23598.1 uncharacterized protein SOCEGT47_041250 [Sorangium cellulosum]
MQEVESARHPEIRALLDSMVGKRLTSITRHVLNDPDETACAFEWLVGLDLRFGRSVLRIDVNPDDDTLVVAKARQQRRSGPDTLIIDGASHPLWRPAMGQTLAFAWTMVNSKGYLDGLAFAFDVYAPSAMLVSAGSQIHEFSAQDRDRRVSETTAIHAPTATHGPTKHSVNQAIDAFISNIVNITRKAAARAAAEALKGNHGPAAPAHEPKAARGSGANLARSRMPSKDPRLTERVYDYIRNHPGHDITQISRGIGVIDRSKVQSAIRKLQDRGDIRRSGLGGGLVATPGRARG